MFTDNPAGYRISDFSADDEYKLDSPFFPPQNAICSSAVSFLAFTGGMDHVRFLLIAYSIAMRWGPSEPLHATILQSCSA